jgi:hypothetical protein
MILMVTNSLAVSDCAAQLAQAIGEPVLVAHNFLEATDHLRSTTPTAVIFDHHLIETDPNEAETAHSHLADAVSIEINFALTGIDRLIREVRSCLERRRRDHSAARIAAAHLLRSELNDTLTGLLLNCDLASSIPTLSPAAIERLASIRQATQILRAQLETNET